MRSAVLVSLLSLPLSACQPTEVAQTAPAGTPQYRVDPQWPAALPDSWILGQVSGIAVDAQDNVWLLQRPRSLTEDEMAAAQQPPGAACCVPAPSVIQLDRDGNVLRAWGGPQWDPDTQVWRDADAGWPEVEHGIYVDGEFNVWIGGNGDHDHVVLKYSVAGEPLMTIGRPGETGGSNDVVRLGRPAAIAVDTDAREVFIADGYGNRRVIVFDMDTGEYRRHWGAYGREPDDGALADYRPGQQPAAQFLGPVHAIRLARDGRVYVADRSGNRIQVFERDGRFLTESVLAPDTIMNGSVWDLALSPYDNERWLFVADGANRRIWVVERDTLDVVGSFGRGGRQAGQFDWVHNIAVDSSGNLFTAEVNTGKRVQKFVRLTGP